VISTSGRRPGRLQPETSSVKIGPKQAEPHAPFPALPNRDALEIQ
jgi:hypothetical protein